MTGGSYDISIWWRNTMISMSLSVSVRREDRSRPRIRHRPRQQRVKAMADHGRWRRTLPAQSGDRGFGALHHGTERSPEAHLLSRSNSSVGDLESQCLIERGTICLFDGSEQLRQVTQHRERFNDFVEREWLGSWGRRLRRASA